MVQALSYGAIPRTYGGNNWNAAKFSFVTLLLGEQLSNNTEQSYPALLKLFELRDFHYVATCRLAKISKPSNIDRCVSLLSFFIQI
jgi:hypothetical protein